jgi:hypothetical protein
MINVAKAQALTYPKYLNKVGFTPPYIQLIGNVQIKFNGANAMYGIEMNDNKKATPLISAAYSKFPNTMNAVVKLPEGINELYLYNDAGELRGNTKTMKVEGQDLAFITIYGDKPEKLTAHIGANNVSQITTKIFNFSSDAIMGSIPNPILIELPNQEVKIFPNPFHDHLKVTINSKEKGQAKIMIYNMMSSIAYYENTFNINAGVNTLKIVPNVLTGAYVIKIQIGDKVVLNKIIKD